jgi:hypothetical protein
MSEVTTMQDLLTEMKAGARLMQAHIALRTLGRAREVFYLERDGEKRVVRTQVFRRAQRAKRIELDIPNSDGFKPQAWRLKQRSIPARAGSCP